MKIAVTYEDGNVFQHFGQTENFKLYNVTDGAVVAMEVFNTNGNGHGALAYMLKEYEVDTLICGGIGAGAKNALAGLGINLYCGVTGDTDKAVSDLLAGCLNYNADLECDHHDHHHGGEGHNCECSH